jgi:hypothetical protein
MELILAQQIFVKKKKAHTNFRENEAKDLVIDTRSQMAKLK